MYWLSRPNLESGQNRLDFGPTPHYEFHLLSKYQHRPLGNFQCIGYPSSSVLAISPVAAPLINQNQVSRKILMGKNDTAMRAHPIDWMDLFSINQ